MIRRGSGSVRHVAPAVFLLAFVWHGMLGRAAEEAQNGDGSSNPKTSAGTQTNEQPPASPRTWTSRGGKFTVEATLVRVENGKVVLRRPDGKQITVALSDLCDADQKYVASVAGGKPAGGGESASAGPPKKRSWTSRGGKFAVEATLVRAENGKVVLRRADDKEVTVPLDQLSDADQQYVATLTGERPQTDTDLIAITPTDLDDAPVVDFKHAGAWTYEPDPSPPSGALRPLSIPLKPGEFFDRVERLIMLPDEKRAVLVYVNHHPQYSNDPVCSVQVCDLAGGKADMAGVFATGVAPIDAANDGSLVLARSEAFGLDTNSELRLYARNGNKVKPVKAWTPYAGRSIMLNHLREAGSNVPQDFLNSVRESADRFNPDANVAWAKFVGSKHVLTMGGTREIALWEIPSLKPVYVTKTLIDAVAGISAGRKYIAVLTNDGIAIMRTLDGAVVGTLPAETDGFSYGMLAFSGDGKRLVLSQGTRVRVWDLTTREQTHDFALASESSIAGGIAWVGDEHLLVGGYWLVAVDHRVVVATYAGGNSLAQICDGLVWMTDARGANLSSEKAPSQAARDLVADLEPESLLKVRPGMEVALDLNAASGANTNELEQAREAIMRRLEKYRLTVVPQADVRLIGAIRPGETKTLHYRTMFPPYEGGDFQATQQILSLSYEVAGQTVWKYESRTYPPSSFSVRQGESPQEALDKIMRQSPTSLGRIWFPSYIAKLPDGRIPIAEGKTAESKADAASELPSRTPKALRRRPPPRNR